MVSDSSYGPRLTSVVDAGDRPDRSPGLRLRSQTIGITKGKEMEVVEVVTFMAGEEMEEVEEASESGLGDLLPIPWQLQANTKF